MNKIRVMVVDDSALMRKLISEILMKDPGLEVVNTAMDGLFALKKIPQCKPDVITLDLDMPRMDGLTALRYIVNDYRIPVVLVSSLTTKGGHLTLEGLSIGAVDFVTKPKDAISVHIHEVASELIQKVKMASNIAVKKAVLQNRERVCLKQALPRSTGAPSGQPVKKVVAIGISTGGPNAISYFLPRLPADFSAAVVIVQHMPEGFTEMFANRLNQVCNIRVKEAKEGDQLMAGTALIAPGNRHLKVCRVGMNGVIVLSSSPAVNGHRPSCDVLFDSVSQEYGSECIGVIMTGMGEDGARGLGRIKESGGYTIAQDEESCVVYGMPKVAMEMGNVQEVVCLEEMPERLTALLKEVPAYAGRARHRV
jgi:two-component system chemotaxis response regulator CheB